MAWLFASPSSTNKIDCGTTVTLGTTAMSLAVRFSPTASEDQTRRIVSLGTTTVFNVMLSFTSGAANRVFFGFTRASGGNATPTWDAGFGAGTIHTLVGTYDGANVRIYADTDTTAKATLAETGTPTTTGTFTFIIGNSNLSVDTNAADSTIYEVAWWPTTTLTAQQAASFGAGFDARTLRPLPTNHWRLTEESGTTAIDGLGGKNGTVTGATIAAHTVKLYYPGAALPFAAAVSTFTTGLGGRRTFAGLGTRTGSRQPQEV